ncbi:hypothetical protein [Hymenobacter sp. DG25A]|uniref:hypothetical protein n=1 Tax=Hymenobacter sp. DG25A TaxID=1385663 RepID=UPI0012F92466|nr:hypothetical protein [Hymenobacter sp. DG25A]
MRISLLLLSSFCILLPISATYAQSPGHSKRHYNAQARPYYRGPVRFTAGGGVAFYNGDLGGLSQNFIGPAGSIGVLYMWHPGLQVGAEFSGFQIGAKDRLASRGEFNNLAFRGRNASLIAQVRLGLLRDNGEFADSHGSPAVLKPYLRLGVGGLLYSPEAYEGTTRPDNGTTFISPERNDYPAVAFIAPVGLGLTVRASRRVNVTTEATYFFTSTDQLDDVSTIHSGNAQHNDGYGLLELKLEYALRP